VIVFVLVVPAEGPFDPAWQPRPVASPEPRRTSPMKRGPRHSVENGAVSIFPALQFAKATSPMKRGRQRQALGVRGHGMTLSMVRRARLETCSGRVVDSKRVVSLT